MTFLKQYDVTEESDTGYPFFMYFKWLKTETV
jgi:hypothetical protein